MCMVHVDVIGDSRYNEFVIKGVFDQKGSLLVENQISSDLSRYDTFDYRTGRAYHTAKENDGSYRKVVTPLDKNRPMVILDVKNTSEGKRTKVTLLCDDLSKSPSWKDYKKEKPFYRLKRLFGKEIIYDHRETIRGNFINERDFSWNLVNKKNWNKEKEIMANSVKIFNQWVEENIPKHSPLESTSASFKGIIKTAVETFKKYAKRFIK